MMISKAQKLVRIAPFMQANNRASYVDIGRGGWAIFFDEWLDYGSACDHLQYAPSLYQMHRPVAGEYILSQALAEAMYDSEFFAKTSALASALRWA